MKVAIPKRIELEGYIKHEENKLNELQDPTYSDDQRKMIEDRINKLKDELNERKQEIGILKVKILNKSIKSENQSQNS